MDNSLHDAWVERLTVSETSSGERPDTRSLEIRVVLLSAWHNGHIELHYKDVQSYRLSASSRPAGHGDWLVDEVGLSEEGSVVHRIRFSSGARWTIECADIGYEWKPFPSLPPLPVEPEVDDCGIGCAPGTRRLRAAEREVLELIKSTGGHRVPLASFLNRLHSVWGAMPPEEFLRAVQRTIRDLGTHRYITLAAEADWQQGRYLWTTSSPSPAAYAEWEDRDRTWKVKHAGLPGRVFVLMTAEGHGVVRLERAFPPPEPGEEKWLRFTVEGDATEEVSSYIRSLGIAGVQARPGHVDARIPSGLVGRVARLSGVTRVHRAPDTRQLTWSHLGDDQSSA